LSLRAVLRIAIGSKDVDTNNALIDLANWAIICLVQLRREQAKRD
jgi:hypothetical protein